MTKKLQIADCRLQNGGARSVAPSVPSSQLSTNNSQLPAPSPKECARLLYQKHGHDFDADLHTFRWPNGVTVDEPDCFALAFATKTEEGDWCWFVKTAVGDLQRLVRHFPIRLPFISFCREKTGKRMKTYRLDRLVRAVKLLSGIRFPVSEIS